MALENEPVRSIPGINVVMILLGEQNRLSSSRSRQISNLLSPGNQWYQTTAFIVVVRLYKSRELETFVPLSQVQVAILPAWHGVLLIPLL